MSRNSIHRIDIAILIAAVAGYLLFFQLTTLTWAELFWDFDVYQRAVADVELGADPYRLDAGYPFLYHPSVLYAFVLLDRFVGLESVLLGLYAAAVLIFLWGYKSVRLSGFRAAPLEDASLGDKAVALLVVFSVVNNLGAIVAANITFYLHLALIGSTLAYIERRSTGRQLLVLAIFSCTLLVKPYFLIYALPLLLIDRFSFRTIAGVTGSALASAAVYLWFWVLYHGHTLRFIEALNSKVSSGDLTGSPFGVLLSFLPLESALEVHIVIAGMLALLVFFLRRISITLSGSRDNDGMLFLLAYVLMTFCSPRMKDYDLASAFICLYLYLSCHGSFGRSLVLLSLLIVQLPLWVMLYYGRVHTPEIFSMHYLWVAAALLPPWIIFFCWKAWRTRGNGWAVIAAD
jgi:hypothetical protein